MSKTNNATAVEIGKTIRNARIDKGFSSRNSLIETKRVKGKLTQEGLRKIESGERIPKVENIRLLGEVLGLSKRKIKELEKKALSENVKRATRRAGNVTAVVQIDGVPVRVEALPPKKKTEAFVRKSVDEIMQLAEKLGWFQIEQDRAWFRRHARAVLHNNLSSST